MQVLFNDFAAANAGETTTFCVPTFANNPFKNVSQWNWRVLLLLVLGIGLGLPTGFAQSTVKHDLSPDLLQVSVPDVILDSGETAVVTFSVGRDFHSATELFTELEFSPAARTPVLADFSFRSSWICNLQNAGLAAHPQQLELRSLPQPAANGSGVLFELTLEATADATPARQLLTHSGGHILTVVEDLGFKQSPSHAPADGPVFYPQPATGTLYFEWPGEVPDHMAIFDLQGKQIAAFDRPFLEKGAWLMPPLPAGTYIARIEGPQPSRHLLRLQ